MANIHVILGMIGVYLLLLGLNIVFSLNSLISKAISEKHDCSKKQHVDFLKLFTLTSKVHFN